jgi:hypothetical protein
LHRVGLLDAHEDEDVEDASADSAVSTILGKFILKMGQKVSGTLRGPV